MMAHQVSSPKGARRSRKRLGRGDGSLMYELGHFASRHEGDTRFEIYSGASSVERLLKDAAPLWRLYCDTGAFETPEVAPGRLRAALLGFPDISSLHCHLLVGWIEGMGLSTGARSSTVEQTRCVHRGDDCCEYTCRWS